MIQPQVQVQIERPQYLVKLSSGQRMCCCKVKNCLLTFFIFDCIIAFFFLINIAVQAYRKAQWVDVYEPDIISILENDGYDAANPYVIMILN